MILKMNCLSVGYNSENKIPLLHLGNYNGPDRDKRPLCRRCNNAKNGKGPFRSAQEKKCYKHLSEIPGR